MASGFRRTTTGRSARDVRALGDIGEHGVRRVLGEAVRAVGPLVDKLLGGHVPDNPLRAVLEKYKVDGAMSCKVSVV